MRAKLAAIAREAGDAILAIYGQNFAVSEKADGSPLTTADEAANRIIVEALARLTPGTPVLSEESAGVPWLERRRWQRFWLVDPLDGTKEFIQRTGEFTVNIALVEQGRPVMGVVHVPAQGVTYTASVQEGAFRQNGGAITRIQARSSCPLPPRVVASRSHRGERLDGWLERLGAHEIVSIGSSLKFCLVAEGAADLYPRLGPTMEWDTAAGQCIAECAGALVLDPAGARLACNKGDSLVNPDFLVSGDRSAAHLDRTGWAALAAIA